MGHHHEHTHDHHDHGHAPGAHQHDQGHDHGLGHSHAPASFGLSFAIGIALNAGFVLAEAGYGLAINSMSLLADAGHNLSDVLSLVAAWGAMALARRGATPRYTFGLKGGTILAALFNSVLLMVAVGAIAWEAAYRLWHPVEVPGLWLMVIAGLGIIVNGGTALLFRSGQTDDINIKGAYLHMAADAGISAGVVLAGLVMLKTGWTWLDPLASLAIVAVIIWSGWRLMAESVALTINAAPATINPAEVRAFLAAQKGVSAVHDLHIWAMSTTDTALTAHLLMPQGHPGDRFLTTLTEELRAHHRIGHATLQIETDPSTQCAMHCDMAA